MPSKLRCKDCGFTAKTTAGLATHQRAKHAASADSNLAAVEKTLAELRRMGRLEEVDAARVQLLRSLAKAVDDDPLNGSLWRQYQAALDDVTKANDDADDSFSRAVAELVRATKMGDPSAS